MTRRGLSVASLGAPMTGAPRTVRRAAAKAIPNGKARRQRKAWMRIVRAARKRGARLEQR